MSSSDQSTDSSVNICIWCNERPTAFPDNSACSECPTIPHVCTCNAEDEPHKITCQRSPHYKNLPIISIITAMNENRIIGKNGKLPWYIPQDLAWFREKTLNKTIIMGRKTHESIGKKLPKRLNIVLSRNKNYFSPYSNNVHVCNSMEHILNEYRELDELVVIGGAEIYKEALPLVKKMYITKVNTQIEGDTYFPKFDINNWKTTEYFVRTVKSYILEFNILERL